MWFTRSHTCCGCPIVAAAQRGVPNGMSVARDGKFTEWRGRGIGGALKRTQIAWAKERGYERLSTMNEERNEPIRRLNRRYGYEPVPGRIFVRGPLAPVEASGP